ncbi:unnamed protein product [Hymenolepis diminuta]|uniref:Secreted protein n=1 Tax=Hymenolepis diminuta TaxID=6216 RepID=A0A0R3SAP1_HYMDI|nr:unnamed protein product [Hymenolepis diminuta]
MQVALLLSLAVYIICIAFPRDMELGYLFLYQVSKICEYIEHRLEQCKELLSRRKFQQLSLVSNCNSLSAGLTLLGDTIYDAIIKITKSSSGHIFTAYIHEGYGTPFKLQQIQDCWNWIYQAAGVCDETSLPELRRCVQGAIDALLFPPSNRAVLGFERSTTRVSWACFYPPLSPDSALHIYLDGGKLVVCANLVFREKFTLSAVAGSNATLKQYWASTFVDRIKKVLELLYDILTDIETCSLAMAS